MSQDTDILSLTDIDGGRLLISGSRSYTTFESANPGWGLFIELTFIDPKNKADGHLAFTLDDLPMIQDYLNRVAEQARELEHSQPSE